MRGRHVLALWAVLVAGLCLGLMGCKATPTSDTAEETSEAVTEEAGHEHEQASAEDQDQAEAAQDTPGPRADPEEVFKELQSRNEHDVLHAIEDVLRLATQDDRNRAKGLLRTILADEERSPEVQAAALGPWSLWIKEEPGPVLKAAESPHADVRAAAAATLGAGDSATVIPCLEKLKDDADSAVAAAAAVSLADVLARSEEGGTDTLIEDLGHPEGDRSALAGMRLEQRGRVDRALVDRLTQDLLTSTRPAQRASLVTVIGLASAGASLGQEKFASHVHTLTRGLSAPDDAYTKPVPTLIRVLETDPEPMVREAAAESLGLIGAAEAAPALGRALTDSDEHVRRRAAAALIVVPPETVKDELTEAALHDPSPNVRRFAVEAMANLPPGEGADGVALCLRDGNPEVRRYAAEVLGRIGTQRHTEALMVLFDDINDDVRWKAVEAVAGFADPRAQKALLDALWDPSPRVALAAERGVHALGIGKRVLTKEELAGRRTPR